MKSSTTLFLLVIVLILSTSIQAQTNISGTINGDSTVVWTLANSPYIITGSTTISAGDTVSIESGVQVKFDNGTQLTVTGALITNGVTFTGNTESSRQTWNRIYTNSASSWVHLKNSTIQFATHAIDNYLGTVRLDTVTISDSKYGVFVNQGSTTYINGSTLTGNIYPVFYASEGRVSYEGINDLTGNDIDVVYLSIPVNIDVNLRLEYPGVPYLLSGTKYVSTGDTLTIDPKNILKFQQSTELYTHNGGVIIADATEGNEIYFTSNRNDNIGGDTNDDGTNTSATNRDWYGIRVIGNTTKSTFSNVNVSFAGYYSGYNNDYRGGISLIDNDSEIDSSTFNNNYYGIVLKDSSDASITNNTIGSSGVVPVALTFDSSPVFTNNSFSSSNNEYDAIGLIGTTIQGSNYLPKRDFTSIPNVTYLLLSELYVDNNASLGIEPGVVIKSTGPGIRVKGTLSSNGTSANPIVFTSVKDDNVGNPNDTNKDGNNTAPNNSDWRGIALGENSDASVINYNEIRYATFNTAFYYGAGSGYVHPRGALNLYSADVTVSNSSIGNTTNFAIDSRGTSTPTFTNNSFSNTGSVPIALDLSSDPTFGGNTLANVGLTAIGYHGGILNSDGFIRARTFAGYSNITSVLLENTTIASGTTLTIEPGTVIKAQYQFNGLVLRVEGTLIAAGAADNVIYFTSILDDQVGNPLDTNGDGGGTSPSMRNWGAIRFMGTSNDAASEVSHSELRYGYHGIIFTDAAPTIDNVTILSCGYYGFGIESGSTVSITNSTIQNCERDPVSISSNANPSFSGITFNSNGSNGINLLESNNLTSTYGVNASNKYFDTRSTINSDVTITPYSFAGYSNIPFIFRNNWTVGTNATVSVDPSVVFKGDDAVYVDGALRVLGTDAEPVIFTSYNDDSAGGDSNNDGNNTVPERNQSAKLYFRASSLDSANLVKHTEFRYPSTAIFFQNAGGLIDSSLFQLTGSNAIDLSGNADPVISNNRFENIGVVSFNYRAHSIYMDMFTNPTFINNVESNVSKKGLAIKGGTWGSDATIPFRSFAGSNNISYVMYGTVSIPSGSKITIPAGMVIKRYTGFSSYRSTFNMFNVSGALEVAGTADNPVIFTHEYDDDYGTPADILGNGDADANEIYRSGDWITYSATSDDVNNVIQHALFRFGNVGVVANSADPTIENSIFEYGNFGVQLTGVSAPTVTDNAFKDLRYTPLLTSLVSYPSVVSGNTMSGTTYKAIGVQSETLVQDITLPKRTFAGKIGIPYYYTGPYTIGTGAVLTIEPGVINKFNTNAQMKVQKGLIAEGGSTPDSMIVFTSIFDDFYGGDTNADSNATRAGINNWYGIRYEGTSLPSLSKLDYTIIKYARGSTNYAAVLADNSSPTITNSVLSENARGVQIYGSGNPVINNSDIYANTEYGIFNRDETFTIDATGNWWGNNTGPEHSGNIGGTGDKVTDGVNYGSFTGSGASNPVLGDASLNGNVQSFDAALVLQHVAGSATLNSTQLSVSDVSDNGSVGSMDASYILQYSAGIIDVFPAELNSKARSDFNTYQKDIEALILSLGEQEEISANEFRVPVYLENVSQLFALDLTLEFDENTLEFIGVDKTSITEALMSSNNNAAEGALTLAMASSEAIHSSGVFYNLTFREKEENSSRIIEIESATANDVDLSTLTVGLEDLTDDIPDEFKLYQNYPNPFNPSTTIGFDVPDNNTIVRMEIFNVLGQKVKTLVNDVYTAGKHTVTWDGTNNSGITVSTGVYLYRIQAGDIVQSKKLTFIK